MLGTQWKNCKICLPDNYIKNTTTYKPLTVVYKSIESPWNPSDVLSVWKRVKRNTEEHSKKVKDKILQFHNIGIWNFGTLLAQ